MQENKMKIAIIGSGIAGLTCGYLLSQKHDITLFEKEDYIGGHTKTIKVNDGAEQLAIDAGFIVFNEKTYPNFCKILKREQVAYEQSEMSFSFSDEQSGLEYNGHSLTSLFAQKKNIFNKKFYKMLIDIVRFNQAAKQVVQQKRHNKPLLVDFLADLAIGEECKNYYLYPMAQAIWSAPLEHVSQFSTPFLLKFYYNHGLLNIINRPNWYVISGGSQSYIPKLIKRFQDKIHLNSPVTKVLRDDCQITVVTAKGAQIFDKVIFATHSNQALSILEHPTNFEEATLSKMPFANNTICLHTDPAVMPANRAAWASWNFKQNKNNECQLTYYINRLQNLASRKDYFVSVNQSERIKPEKILKQFTFSHPVMTSDTIAAQTGLDTLNGTKNTYYCGAYWFNGFHEDGVVSALKTCQALGVSL